MMSTQHKKTILSVLFFLTLTFLVSCLIVALTMVFKDSDNQNHTITDQPISITALDKPISLKAGQNEVFIGNNSLYSSEDVLYWLNSLILVDTFYQGRKIIGVIDYALTYNNLHNEPGHFTVIALVRLASKE